MGDDRIILAAVAVANLQDRIPLDWGGDPLAVLVLPTDELTEYLHHSGRAGDRVTAHAHVERFKARLLNDRPTIEASFLQWLLSQVDPRTGALPLAVTDEEILKAHRRFRRYTEALRKALKRRALDVDGPIDRVALWNAFGDDVIRQYRQLQEAGTLTPDCFPAWFIEGSDQRRSVADGLALIMTVYGPELKGLLPPSGQAAATFVAGIPTAPRISDALAAYTLAVSPEKVRRTRLRI